MGNLGPSLLGNCGPFVKNWLLFSAFLLASFLPYLLDLACLHWKDQLLASKHICIHNPLPDAWFDMVGHQMEQTRNGLQPIGRG